MWVDSGELGRPQQRRIRDPRLLFLIATRSAVDVHSQSDIVLQIDRVHTVAMPQDGSEELKAKNTILACVYFLPSTIMI